MRKVLLTATILFAGIIPAHAGKDDVQVYRCVAKDGSISLQDHSCPSSSEATLKRLPRPDDPHPSLDKATRPAESDANPVSTPDAARSSPGNREPPTLWICVDHQGKERESNDGIPEGRYVPLWVVGRDPYAPAQTFGRVGEPRPLPRVQPADGPRTRTASPHAPSPLVYVEERCRPLSPGRICDRYLQQRRELEREIFNAQSSDRAVLKPEVLRLKRLLADHCP